MARNEHRRTGASGLPAPPAPRLVRALDHVSRRHILLSAARGEVSPQELSTTFGEPLGQVSHHVKVLRDDCDGLLEETRAQPRRGTVERFYRASAKALMPAEIWGRLTRDLRVAVIAGQASDLFNDLASALLAGKLGGAHDHIVRSSLVLDAEGQRNVKAIAERTAREVEEEQDAATRRMAGANGGGARGCAFGLMAFEAASKSPSGPVSNSS